MSAFNPGDVVVQEAILSGQGVGVDVTRRIKNFAVYEHITKAYTSIVLTIVDNTDVLNFSLGLDGGNAFRMSFGQPGQDPYSGNWTLTSVERSRSTVNQRTVVYKATGYSPHMLRTPKVQEVFRDAPMTDAFSSIVSKYLSPLKPLVVRAPARNMSGDRRMPFNVNGVQVWKAIQQVMRASSSSVDSSSAYVFFENNKSMVLDTLENLLTRVGAGPTYYQRPLGGSFLVDQALQQFTIITAIEGSRVDATSDVQSKSQTSKTFDVFSHVFDSQSFGSGDSSVYNSMPYNAQRVASFALSSIAQKRRVAEQFDGNSLTIHVPLNPALTVGEGFNAEILAPMGDTNQAVLDRASGPRLATEVVHSVDLSKPRMQGTSTVKGVRI